MRIAVVGGGAAGCFCAVNAARCYPEAEIILYEAGPKLLAKVAVTGGGRCNLTNSFRDVERLAEVYPRGEQLMKRALRRFSHEDTMRWFEAEGVRLTVQDDQCVFPVSQDAMQIVRTLERCLRESGVQVRCNAKVEKAADLDADRIVVAVGGSSREKLCRLLPPDIDVTPCVPSLFTLKIPDDGLRALMGTVVERTALSLAGTKFRSRGTLLLTDWGVSGPATLRLSSYAARHLAENGYGGTLLVDWLDASETEARAWIAAAAAANPRKQAAGTPPDGITA
ncbi:MAG: aminoacetone oxidase family FAD-binding enzyme, partial [Bacteroidales bacterium]|nr:aminoacetone oxidase family FAD-binding enzyme [Bacteroidales bacterium]